MTKIKNIIKSLLSVSTISKGKYFYGFTLLLIPAIFIIITFSFFYTIYSVNKEIEYHKKQVIRAANIIKIGLSESLTKAGELNREICVKTTCLKKLANKLYQISKEVGPSHIVYQELVRRRLSKSLDLVVPELVRRAINLRINEIYLISDDCRILLSPLDHSIEGKYMTKLPVWKRYNICDTIKKVENINPYPVHIDINKLIILSPLNNSNIKVLSIFQSPLALVNIGEHSDNTAIIAVINKNIFSGNINTSIAKSLLSVANKESTTKLNITRISSGNGIESPAYIISYGFKLDNINTQVIGKVSLSPITSSLTALFTKTLVLELIISAIAIVIFAAYYQAIVVAKVNFLLDKVHNPTISTSVPKDADLETASKTLLELYYFLQKKADTYRAHTIAITHNLFPTLNLITQNYNLLKQLLSEDIRHLEFMITSSINPSMGISQFHKMKELSGIIEEETKKQIMLLEERSSIMHAIVEQSTRYSDSVSGLDAQVALIQPIIKSIGKKLQVIIDNLQEAEQGAFKVRNYLNDLEANSKSYIEFSDDNYLLSINALIESSKMPGSEFVMSSEDVRGISNALREEGVALIQLITIALKNYSNVISHLPRFQERIEYLIYFSKQSDNIIVETSKLLATLGDFSKEVFNIIDDTTKELNDMKQVSNIIYREANNIRETVVQVNERSSYIEAKIKSLKRAMSELLEIYKKLNAEVHKTNKRN